MTAALRFDPIRLPPECEQLRKEVRAFLAEEIAASTFDPYKPNREDTDVPEFSRKVGAKGWLGMTWPKKYGGHERSFLERYVVTEEMRVANAPTRRFFVADRQSGPVLLKYAPENIKMDILPRICRGEVCFAIGMSEPDSGSDLASIRTRAEKVDGGYKVNGTKIWTSNAHLSDFAIALFRTKVVPDKKHEGLSQFLVDLKSPGISIRPIIDLAGGHHFNEVHFQDCLVPDDMLVGKDGEGWKQVTTELGFERSGPERYLSSLQLVIELIREAGHEPPERAAALIGHFTAHLVTLRQMSLSIATMLQAGQNPNLEAAVVKDIGTTFEQEIPEAVHALTGAEPRIGSGSEFEKTLGYLVQHAPSFSLRGGTREVLRGIIARGLGLR